MRKNNFGKKLKELREKEGLTQRELAERAGLHITTIANYEINRREPKANQIKLLAQALDADMNELFTPEGDGHGRGSARRYLIAEVSIRMPHRVVPALSVNISDKGIGLYADERIDANQEVILTLKVLMNDASEAPEEVPGTVVWSRPMRERYAAGVRFKKTINSKDFSILAKYAGKTTSAVTGAGYG